MASGGVDRLRRRAEYLRVQAANRRVALPGLLLQAAPAVDPDNMTVATLRIGFTASRKVGNAVLRNRAKRRLKALAADLLPCHAQPGHDYVLVARQATPARDFAALRGDLEAALKKLRLWRAAPSAAGASGLGPEAAA
ncbi:ribonuclease P protein component [Ferrovibrio xuzhouensis]|uniref:Ribonuclease P protein component n=1 Tax=Ferrovibrio xuzhouensis TaxID=1576914 RepID=A0ABV7VIU0_9PROT